MATGLNIEGNEFYSCGTLLNGTVTLTKNYYELDEEQYVGAYFAAYGQYGTPVITASDNEFEGVGVGMAFDDMYGSNNTPNKDAMTLDFSENTFGENITPAYSAVPDQVYVGADGSVSLVETSVSENEDLQGIIDSAEAGDTIYIEEGTYTLNKPLSIDKAVTW